MNVWPIGFRAHAWYDLVGGTLTLSDPLVPGDPWADGSARLDSQFSVGKGRGYLLLFRTTPGTHVLISFEYGAWASPFYRSFWIEDGALYRLFKGPDELSTNSLGFNYRPDTWHYLLMRLNADSVEGRIWSKDQPAAGKDFLVDTGTRWAWDTMSYVINVAEGSIEIDEFQELEFIE